MSKWIWAAASVVFLVVIIGRLAAIDRLLHVASQGIWYLLLIALLQQGLFLLLMLSLLLLAFRSPVSFGVLIAGYAVGSLLAIISITPSGLGPVEGIMILTYSDLGVMPEAATLVTLVYRGLSFWLPFVTGFAALRRLG